MSLHENFRPGYQMAWGRNESGLVSVVAIWVLVILTLLAVALGRRAAVDIALARYSVGQLRSKFLATSGVMYAISLLPAKGSSAQGSGLACQSLSSCGVVLPEGQIPEEIFHEKKLGEGYFDIYYIVDDGSGDKVRRYGLQDEAARINLNANPAIKPISQYAVLKELLIDIGEESSAEDIIQGLMAWRNLAAITDAGQVAGAAADQALPVTQDFLKKGNLESEEEFLMVKGMTPEIFEKIRPYITIFPAQGLSGINWRTASVPVLRAWAFAIAKGPAQLRGEAKGVVESLVNKIVTLRLKKDNDFIEDLKGIDSSDYIGKELSLQEGNIWQLMWSAPSSSQFFRIHSQGVDGISKVRTGIEAIMDRQGKIHSWRRVVKGRESL